MHPAVLGTDVSGLAPGAALAACGADWEVRLLPAAALFPDGSHAPVPGHRFVVAGDVPVGAVGSRWHPVQNAELLAYALGVAERLGTGVSRAGVTGGRRRFWCLLEMGTAALLVSTAHHGRGAVSAQVVVPAGAGLVRFGPDGDWTASYPHGPTLASRLSRPSELAGWAAQLDARAALEVGRLSGAVPAPSVLLAACEGVVPASRATTGRRESNRHAVLDRVATRWVQDSAGRRDAFSLLAAVAGYLDTDRKASPGDRADQSVDDSGWVTRAKTVAWGAVSG